MSRGGRARGAEPARPNNKETKCVKCVRNSCNLQVVPELVRVIRQVVLVWDPGQVELRVLLLRHDLVPDHDLVQRVGPCLVLAHHKQKQLLNVPVKHRREVRLHVKIQERTVHTAVVAAGKEERGGWAGGGGGVRSRERRAACVCKVMARRSKTEARLTGGKESNYDSGGGGVHAKEGGARVLRCAWKR